MWVDVLYGASFDPTCKIIYDGKRFSSIPFRIESLAINIVFEGHVYLFIVSDAIKNVHVMIVHNHLKCTLIAWLGKANFYPKRGDCFPILS